MLHLQFILALAIFITFGIYVFFGLYTISNNTQAPLNRVFAGICLSLSIWSFGYSMVIFAPSIESCIFWRRIAAIGWSPLYCVWLHFVVILTGNKRLLDRWWKYLLLYAPAAICLYNYALAPLLPGTPQDLAALSLGYLDIKEKSYRNLIYCAYYIISVLYSLALLWDWGRKSDHPRARKQADLISGTIWIALVIGSAWDIVSNFFLPAVIPQIAPMVILLPMGAILISMKNYGLMKPQPIRADESILNVSTRPKINKYLAFALLGGAMLNFISQYFVYGVEFGPTSYFSLFLAATGYIVFKLPDWHASREINDHLLIGLLCVLVPIITLRFIEFASVTVWAFPFIFLLVFILFNKRTMLLSLSISIILTQIIVWIVAPNVTVNVEGSDHIVRIGLFVMGIWLAFYVNNVYVQRLKENSDQIQLQKIIARISSEFVSAELSNLDQKQETMLQVLGQFMPVERLCVFRLDEETDYMDCMHEWRSQSTEDEMEPYAEIRIKIYPWLSEYFAGQDLLYVRDVEQLPRSAIREVRFLTRLGLRSVVAVPIRVRGRLQGLLGAASVYNRPCVENHLDLMRITGNIVADAWAKTEAEADQHWMAFYDQLTGLPNRALFRDRANQAIHLAGRNDKLVAVIYLDLDSFKSINDTMGHEGGDELLKVAAEALSGCVRGSDTVCRYGGDEFLLLINHLDEAKVIAKIADKIMAIFSHPFVIRGQEFFITASAGVALYPVDGEDVNTLIKNADIAMYAAKEKGRNRFVLCSPDMKDQVQRLVTLTNHLYRAQERDELVLYYQPQVDMKSRRIIGFEALLRWKHTNLGMIYPGNFIHLAEKTGLINPIGAWVIRTACEQSRAWMDMGCAPMRMAVNISAVQFRNPNFIAQVETIIMQTGMEPSLLELEITESIAIKESSHIVDILNRLKKLGVSISIDDFGTEYSSLSRLKMLPVDRIKMDMQFVKGISESNKDRAIAKVIINLAKSLGLKVIAEGVENAAQLNFLEQRQCDEIQGYYYYKPMPAHEVEAILLMDKPASSPDSHQEAAI